MTLGFEVPVDRFAAFGDLSSAEQASLQALASSSARVKAGADVRAHWSRSHAAFFLHEGWALSSVELRDGGRQILKIHLPGDVMGAPSLAYEAPVETLTMLTAGRVSPVALDALGELFRTAPRLAAVLFLQAQEERVILMDRLTAMGRMDAESRVLSLLAHLRERLAPPDEPAARGPIPLPMTQAQIADVLGLTSVHVSRVLRRLEKAGWIRRQGRTIELLDAARLRESAAFPARVIRRDPDWLPRA